MVTMRSVDGRTGLSRLACTLVLLCASNLCSAAEEATSKWAAKLTDERMIMAVALAPDGKSLVSGGNGIKKWDLTTSKAVEGGDWGSHLLNVSDLVFSPDGKCVVSSFGGDDGVRVWDSTGKLVRELKTAGSSGNAPPRFSADGKMLMTEGWDRQSKVLVWDFETGKLVKEHRYKLTAGHLASLACSADSRLMGAVAGEEFQAAIAAQKGFVVLFDISANKELFKLDCGKELPRAVALSPRAELLAAGTGDGQVFIWDVGTGKQLHSLKGHKGRVSALAFSADNRLLSSGDMEGLVVLWDAKSGKEIRKCEGHTAAVRSVAFTPDSAWLASGSADRTALVWKLQAEK